MACGPLVYIFIIFLIDCRCTLFHWGIQSSIKCTFYTKELLSRNFCIVFHLVIFLYTISVKNCAGWNKYSGRQIRLCERWRNWRDIKWCIRGYWWAKLSSSRTLYIEYQLYLLNILLLEQVSYGKLQYMVPNRFQLNLLQLGVICQFITL